MTRTDQVLKWIGIGTLVLGVLPAAAIVARDLPGMTREIKAARMGWRGGWKLAH